MSRAKRGATTDLNHDNWDQDEDKEEAGVFKLAPPEEIERRVIKQAVRRRPTTADSNNAAGDMKKNVFGCLNLKAFAIPEAKPNAELQSFNFLDGIQDKVRNDTSIFNQKNETEGMKKNAFGNLFPKVKGISESNPAVAVQSFDFLSCDKDMETKKVTFANQSNDDKTTVFGNMNVESDAASIQSTLKPFGSMHDKVPPKKENSEGVGKLPTEISSVEERNAPTFSSPSSLRDFVEPTFRKHSHLLSKPPGESKKVSGDNISGRSEEFLLMMTEINESFSSWIQKNLDEDPTSILTRCFKDYIRHVQALFDEEKKAVLNGDQLALLKKQEQVLNEVVILQNQQDLEVAASGECNAVKFDD